MEFRWRLRGVVFVALLVYGIKAQQDVCGISQVNSRIVGGSDSVAGAWPWQVAVITGSFLRCGGSLINNEWILTSAACADTMNPSDLVVWLGTESLSEPSSHKVVRSVVTMKKHPSYRPSSLSNNIALLKMASPVTFNKYISPVCLAKSESKYDEGYLWVAGYGKTWTHDSNPLARNLKEVEIPIVPTDVCQRGYLDTLPSTILCAGSGGKGTCDGESGTPLVSKNTNTSRWIQGGLMAFRASTGCAEPGFPEGYTRVSKYEDWIKSQIKTNQPGFFIGAPRSAGTSLVSPPLLLLPLLQLFSVVSKGL